MKIFKSKHGILKINFSLVNFINTSIQTVEARANSNNIDDGFEHLVAHAISRTLESGAECTMGSGVLRFGSLDQVFDDDDLKKFMKGLECLDQGKARMKEGSSKAVGQQVTEVPAR